METHQDYSRFGLLEKYDYTGPQYLYTEHADYIWKSYSMWTNRDYPNVSIRKEYDYTGQRCLYP